MQTKPVLDEKTTSLRGILAAKLGTNHTKNGQPVANVLLRIPGETRRVVELAGFGSHAKTLGAAKCGSELVLVVRNLRSETYSKDGVPTTKEKATIVRYDYVNKLDRLASADAAEFNYEA